MDHVPLLVLGAGVDGLLTALALSHQGFPVHLLDREPDPAVPDPATPDPAVSAGAGPATAAVAVAATALLPPAATQELGALGLLDGLVAATAEPRSFTLADARTGRLLHRVALGPAVRTRWRDPLLVVSLGTMRRLLAGAAASDDMVTVEYGVRPTVVEDVVEGALVGDEHGPAYRAEALVAADGPASPVRSLLRGGRPASAPYQLHRTRWPGPVAREEIRTWSSPLLHLCCTPTPDADTADLALVVRAEMGPAEIARAAAHHAVELREALEAAAFAAPVRVHHHRPLERWTRHRIGVLGAAAQPMLPHDGQALAQTVLDAAALGAAFDRADGRVVAALEDYERARAAPRARAAARAADVADVLHADGMLRRLRDHAWAGTSPDPQAALVGD